MTGSIRARETKQVVMDHLVSRGVSKAHYGFRGGQVHIMVNNREARIEVPANLTFYQLKGTLEKIDRLVEEMKSGYDARQIDIEQSIASNRATA